MGAWQVYHYEFINSQQTFLTEKPNEHDATRISVRHTPMQKDAVLQKNMFVSITFIAALIRFVTMSLVYENKSSDNKSTSIDDNIMGEDINLSGSPPCTLDTNSLVMRPLRCQLKALPVSHAI